MRYFAYCTLMDLDTMRAYCPSAEPDGVVYLPDYELAFATYAPGDSRGGCTIRRKPGERLYGVVYTVPDEEASLLQRKSGVAEGWYTSEILTLIRPEGGKVEAFTLVIPREGDNFSPSLSYVAPITVGARAYHLPPDYIDKLETIIASAVA